MKNTRKKKKLQDGNEKKMERKKERIKEKLNYRIKNRSDKKLFEISLND